MFVLVRATNTTSGKVTYMVHHPESGNTYDLPEWANVVAADRDGEVFAYESTLVHVDSLGKAAFVDDERNARVSKIGVIPSGYMSDDGELENWQFSMLHIERPSAQESVASKAAREAGVQAKVAADSQAALDGSMLRARVIEMIDHNMKADKVGARNARMVLRDVIKDGFTFKNYRTADLVLALVGLGLNLSSVKDYNAFRAIDDAVQEARK